MQLREVQVKDTEAIISLIGGLYQEYGFAICLEDAEADLTDISGNYAAGSFMVLCHDEGGVRATVALSVDKERPQVAWMKRLYLDSSLQGGGHADRLLQWATDQAKESGCTRMELWSDVRFERAHRFYTKNGFQHEGTVRHMTDAYEPYDEFFFYKALTP